MQGSAPIRVVVVEDEPLYRDLLATAVVSRLPGVEVVGAWGTAEEALAAAPALAPDVLLADIHLGRGSTGPSLGIALRRRTSLRGVVLLSNLVLPSILTTLPADVRDGWSYLLKTSVRDVARLGEALHAAAEGRILIDERLVDDLVPTPSGPLARLTPRQLDVLSRMARGWSNRRIAEDLGLSVRSVEAVVSDLLVALGIGFTDDGVNPRVAAVLAYAEHTTSRGGPGIR